MQRRLTEVYPEMKLTEYPEYRLSSMLNVRPVSIDVHGLLDTYPQVAVLTGSPCQSGSVEPSSVLTAMRVPLDTALSAIRFIVGLMTVPEEIRRGVCFRRVVSQLNRESMGWGVYRGVWTEDRWIEVQYKSSIHAAFVSLPQIGFPVALLGLA